MADQFVLDAGRTSDQNWEPAVVFPDMIESAKPIYIPVNENAKEFLKSCQISFFEEPAEENETNHCNQLRETAFERGSAKSVEIANA
ncbi:MAG: hypothetical protein K2X93_20840 [Candidatus Obscuribacterales bacterium]|nr:hypothetical protein [Candidatus Obscuribacterales bacterium]